MKAIVFEKYGPPAVLKIKEIPKPRPNKNELLVRVRATAVGYGDLIARRGVQKKDFNMPYPLFPIMKLVFGIRKPKNGILGSECSGIVEAVGENVTTYKPGDEIFAYLGQNMKGNAEYVVIPEKGSLSLKPKNMSFAEAGSTPYGSIMASNIIERLKVKLGQKVLVIGASGGIGHFAVQYFKTYGAIVTGVCSTDRVALVKSLGADHVLDYTQEKIFSKNGATYDIVFDVLHRGSFGKVKHVLNKNGRYVLTSFSLRNVIHMWYRKIRGGKKILCMMAREGSDKLSIVTKDVEAGKIKSEVDKTFSYEQAAEAHQYIEDGKKKGQIVLLFPD